MKVSSPQGAKTYSTTTRLRKRHAPDEIVPMLRDAGAMPTQC
jgi:hypothetical protein